MPSSSIQSNSVLTPFEEETVSLFGEFAQALGLARSVGEIFGLVFASASPVSFDDVVSRLGISKGSASQGLRLLRQIGAVHVVELPGDRRTFFEPELSLRRLLAGMLEETLRPHLEKGDEHLQRIEQMAGVSRLDPVLAYRVELLRNWHRRTGQLLPWISRFAAAGKLHRRPKSS